MRSPQPAIDPDATMPKALTLGSPVNLVVKGFHFSQNNGTGGTKAVRVKLVDTSGSFVWNPQEKDVDRFVSAQELHVTSTPTAVKAAGERRAGGDLTITVTNGDGTFSLATPINGVTYA